MHSAAPHLTLAAHYVLHNGCRFIRNGMLFDNFYTAPLCAQTRAMVLTGRSYQRTGSMLVNGGVLLFLFHKLEVVRLF
jgi:arylsulfatase A-like enzyme